MAIPTPIFIITISTTLIVLQLSLFPEFLQEAPIRRRYFIFLGITFALLALWNLYIYPLFLSPFRNLPGPKVHQSTTAANTILRDEYLTSHRTPFLLWDILWSHSNDQLAEVSSGG